MTLNNYALIQMNLHRLNKQSPEKNGWKEPTTTEVNLQSIQSQNSVKENKMISFLNLVNEAYPSRKYLNYIFKFISMRN